MMWCVSLTTCFVLEWLSEKQQLFQCSQVYFCLPVALSWLILESEYGLRENSPLCFAQRKENGLSEPSQLPMLEISHEWNNHLVKVILSDNWVHWSWGGAIAFAGISIWTKGVSRDQLVKLLKQNVTLKMMLIFQLKWKEGSSGHWQHFLAYSELHAF